mgnify:CR=1 FL=1
MCYMSEKIEPNQPGTVEIRRSKEVYGSYQVPIYKRDPGDPSLASVVGYETKVGWHHEYYYELIRVDNKPYFYGQLEDNHVSPGPARWDLPPR